MNRYKITFSNNKIIKLYAENKDSLPTFDDMKIKSIEQDINTSYMEYINYIKSGIFLGYDYKNRETYRHITLLGHIDVKISKNDELYYDFTLYQEYHK